MLKKLINARGGLHNRVTHKMLVSPFCLEETEQYFQSKGFNYERPEIIDCYMAVGGVAYYLSLFSKDKSVAENINDLCFTRGGELTDEFNKLYDSLFKKAENHIAVINDQNISQMGKQEEQAVLKTLPIVDSTLASLLDKASSPLTPKETFFCIMEYYGKNDRQKARSFCCSEQAIRSTKSRLNKKIDFSILHSA